MSLSVDKEYHESYVTFSSRDVDQFAEISGDFNPIHLDKKFALTQGFSDRIVHGALLISKVSGIIASDFPGAGTIIGSIEWKFISPVLINQELKMMFSLSKTHTRKGIIDLAVLDDVGCVIQESKITIFTRI
jgi:acyl dehydratase